jgi:ribonuclease P/MRP protein subunit POP5
MVRLKHRYLLVHVLYPNAGDDTKVKLPPNAKDAPYTVQFHRPSSDRLDARLLLQMIRNGVSELFGDYGSGMIAGSLQGMHSSILSSLNITFPTSYNLTFRLQSNTSPQQQAQPSSESRGTTTDSFGQH